MGEKYKGNENPNFIKIDDRTYRVDFDLYKNLYRVRSKKQGDILYTLCYYLNRMYNKIAYRGEFDKNEANYENSYLYQVIKSNAQALNLKCPSYYELTRMAQSHTGSQSFSTLFMEYNGYNGVNVSGVEYYDNTKHGSVIYDLSKIDTEMVEVNPKSLFTGFNDQSYNNTIAQSGFDDFGMQSIMGKYLLWADNLNTMPLDKALRLLKNYTATGKMMPFYQIRKMNDKLQKRYLRILYASVINGWQYCDYIKDEIMDSSTIGSFVDLIKKTNSYYWVNFATRNNSILEEILWSAEFDWDLSAEEEHKQREEYLNKMMGYLKRELTPSEKAFIQEDYYNDK